MTFTSNKYLLAIAMAFFSYIPTVIASDNSMKEDLIKIYEEEEQRLKEEQHYYLMVEEKGINLHDPDSEYDKNRRLPLQLCQKYLNILKNPITPDDTATLIEEYEKQVIEYSGPLEAKYLSNVLAAIYFDRREEHEDYINLAKKYAKRPIEYNMTRRQKAIHNYIQAKIYKKLAVNYAGFANAGRYANNETSYYKPSVVLNRLFGELASWLNY